MTVEVKIRSVITIADGPLSQFRVHPTQPPDAPRGQTGRKSCCRLGGTIEPGSEHLEGVSAGGKESVVSSGHQSVDLATRGHHRLAPFNDGVFQ